MQLSLEQALGQKQMLGFVGTEPTAALRETLAHQHVGGLTLFRGRNTHDPAQVRALTSALQAAAAQAGMPPLLIGVDQEGGQLMAIDGGTTCFPGNLALGATRSPEFAFQMGGALGRELAAMGVNINYAPSCDVNNNPHNPVIGTRSFGEDPTLVGQLSVALVQGLQAAGVAATAKHFPGHGDTASDTHNGVVVVPYDQARLRQIELPPFMAAIAGGVRLVMTGHLALPTFDQGSALPATLSPTILRNLLRRELGFQGVIISDALDMAAIEQGAGLVIDSLAATAAGVDLLLFKDAQPEVHSALVQAARRGLLDHNDIFASAGRILALKQWLAAWPQPALDVIGSAAHQQLANNIAERSITLVRNQHNLLPLQLASDARVLVVLPQPTDLTPADTSSYVQLSLARFIRQYHPHVDEVLLPANPAPSDIAGVQQRLAGYDLVIVGTLNATAQPGQVGLVQALLRSPTPTIVVALRMPYDLIAFPNAPTYLCSYSILPPSLAAIAQALFGRISVTGSLPVSIPGLYPLGHGLTLAEINLHIPDRRQASAWPPGY